MVKRQQAFLKTVNLSVNLNIAPTTVPKTPNPKRKLEVDSHIFSLPISPLKPKIIPITSLMPRRKIVVILALI